MDLSNIRHNYIELKSKIKETCLRCGRDENEIKIIAVSKTFPAEAVAELYNAGHKDFGENRVQELTDKYFDLKGNDIKWHLIGHLQTNKVKYVAGFIELVHSVDSYNLALEIEKSAEKHGRIIDVLVQVNTSNELQKSGTEPVEAKKLCKEISRMEHLRLRGLMTIALFTDDTKIIRSNFKTLADLYKELNQIHGEFKYLSMGMTSDYELAIEEGANMLRIGSAIFGGRYYS